MSGTIRSRQRDGVAEIVLDRPSALNALSTAMLLDLGAALSRIERNSAVRAVVVSSSHDRVFCVGADLKERATFTDDQLVAQRKVLTTTFRSLLGLEIPTIAAIHGHAVGGGFELALSCDIIIADETAVVGLPEVARGLIPGGGGTQLLARRAGPGVAAELIYSARLVEIDEAERRGLIDRKVAPGTARRSALELARTISGHSPLAVTSAKRAIVLGAGTTLERGLEIEEAAWRRIALSADRREGIAAFVEKREPVWSSGADAL